MNVPIRVLLLTAAFLVQSQAQVPESWHGKTSEGRDLSISVVKGVVTSVSISEGVSCLTAVEEGTKVFTGSPAPISGDAIRFTGQATTLCGEIQVRLDGTIAGAKASGTLTIFPPKVADKPAKRKVTWKADRNVAGK
jgi:hypothetical protein